MRLDNINPVIASAVALHLRPILDCTHPREDRRTDHGQITCNRCGQFFGSVQEQHVGNFYDAHYQGPGR